MTLFTRSLPLNLALRIWDCFVFLGTPFFFQASVGTLNGVLREPRCCICRIKANYSLLSSLALGILTLYEDALLAMEAEDIMRFLHNIPKVRSAVSLTFGLVQRCCSKSNSNLYVVRT